MGLGPNGSSVLERTGHKFELTEDWLILDRQERGHARKVAAIRWGMKHKKAVKAVAPVEETNEGDRLGVDRLWKWLGEDNGLKHGELYPSSVIRKQGFKLPKLKKKAGKKDE